MKNWWLFPVLLCIAGLIILDILVRVWLPVNFDAAYFNNLVTPAVSIISIFIYAVTLKYVVDQNRQVQEQNRIIQSQNLRPDFENRIDDILEKIKTKEYDFKYEYYGHKTYNGNNYIQIISEVVRNLITDSDYIEDVNKSKKANRFDGEYMLHRSYSKTVMFFLEFTLGLGNKFHYYTVQSLITDIENSKLIADERSQLKERIKRDIMHEYLSFVSFALNKTIYPPVPVMVVDETQYGSYFVLKSLGDTHFGDQFRWFKEHLNY